MIIQLDKEIYERLSESEALVIDYINQNEDKIPVMSITSIAEKSFTSSATVSRTIQKCGFSGISELKFKISEQKQKKEKTILLMKSIKFWQSLFVNVLIR